MRSKVLSEKRPYDCLAVGNNDFTVFIYPTLFHFHYILVSRLIE